MPPLLSSPHQNGEQPCFVRYRASCCVSYRDHAEVAVVVVVIVGGEEEQAEVVVVVVDEFDAVLLVPVMVSSLTDAGPLDDECDAVGGRADGLSLIHI